jgi:protoporphyrinogen oxidase
MEGTFYYPKGGVGVLMNALADVCGHDRIRLQSKVTRIYHDHKRIRAIEINHTEKIEVDEVISTLPLNRLLEMLHPRLAHEALASYFHFRYLILVAVFIDKPRVTNAATLYFPDKSMPFTRVYEPRNRCASMSPPNKTSFVAEIPCDKTDARWTTPDKELVKVVLEKIFQTGWMRREEVLGVDVQRMRYAYPVLTAGCETFLSQADRLLGQLTNLRYTGRNGLFSYSWIHDQFQWGRSMLEDMGA